MLICLSSGDQPRYRQDVLRAIALPIHAELQFRYDKKWASFGVLKMIEENKIVGQQVLIVYADQSHPENGTAIPLIPVRLASIIGAAAPGSTLSLNFSIGRVVHAGNIAKFNEEIMKLTDGDLPKWVDLKLKGLYCTELSRRPTSITEIENLGGWEYVANQLSERKDFESEETFFTIVGLLTQDKLDDITANLQHTEWPRDLSANEERQLVIYHYHIAKSPGDLQLVTRVGAPLTLESSPCLRLDSRYDLKRLLIRAGDPVYKSKKAWITLSTKGKSATEPLELDMTVTVKPNLLKRLAIGSIIAISLAAAQVIPLVTRADLSSTDKLASGLLIFVASIVVATAVVWGIRRSL